MNQKTIAQIASDFFKVPISKLRSPDRHRNIVWPRHICMYLADSLNIRKSNIGRFWKRDRTAVYNAVRRVEEAMETDKKSLKEIQIISKQLVGK